MTVNALVLTNADIDDAAKAACVARTGNAKFWSQLSEASKVREREAVIASLTSAVRSSAAPGYFKKPVCGHSPIQEKLDEAHKSEIQRIEKEVSGNLFSLSQQDQDDEDIINYVAHRVSTGLPTEETLNKVTIFLDHVRAIATVTLKGKDNAKQSKEESAR